MLLSSLKVSPITLRLTTFSCMFLIKLSVLHNCLTAIKDWMSNNFLQLNTDKTGVPIIASIVQLPWLLSVFGPFPQLHRLILIILVFFPFKQHCKIQICCTTMWLFTFLYHSAKTRANSVFHPPPRVIIHCLQMVQSSAAGCWPGPYLVLWSVFNSCKAPNKLYLLTHMSTTFNTPTQVRTWKILWKLYLSQVAMLAPQFHCSSVIAS